jgi:hypothetical protein
MNFIKMNFKKLFAIIFLLGFVSIPLIALADQTESCIMSDSVLTMMQKRGYTDCSNRCNFVDTPQCGTCCLVNTIYSIADWAFIFIMAAAVIMIILGAADYLKSGGDASALQDANKKIVTAAAAIIIALLAKAVPGIVLSIIA